MSTLLRAVGILFSLVLMVGFGLCGALGLFGASSMFRGRDSIVILCISIAGLAIALLSGWTLRKLLRGPARPGPEEHD